ncbi:hypothetical protein T484DRAFT_1890149, partial [Baffinella frigidus]
MASDAAGRRGCHRMRRRAAWRPLALALFAAAQLCASSGQVDTDGGDDEVMVPVDEPPSSQSLELPRARADGGGLPECRRGEHTTSAEVTRGGHKGCTRRVRAHAVDKDDALGYLVAPMHASEFFLEKEGGPWGHSPRLIYRQDLAHLRFLGLTDESMPGLLEIVVPLHEPDNERGRHGGVENGKDIRFHSGTYEAPGVHGFLGQRIDGEEAVKLFYEGHTVVLHAADMRVASVALFAEQLEDALGVAVSADLVWSPPGTGHGGLRKGSETHEEEEEEGGEGGVGQLGALTDFDRGGAGDSDVLLLQISGRQITWVWEPPAPSSGDSSTVEGLDEETRRFFLPRPGDTLYIPAGFPHASTCNVSFLEAESLHLALSLSSAGATWEAALQVVLDIFADSGHVHFLGMDLTDLGEGAGVLKEQGLGARVEGWGCAQAPLYWQDLLSWAIRGASRANHHLRKVVPMGQVATLASESDTDSGIAEQFSEAVRIVVSLSSPTETYPTENPATDNAANETEDAVQTASEITQPDMVKTSAEIVQLVKAALVEANGRAGASQAVKGWREIEKTCPDAWRSPSENTRLPKCSRRSIGPTP